MVEIVGPPRTAVRNQPITPELRGLLEGAAQATGIQKIVIVSGGQTSDHSPHLEGVVGGWTGSRRHDNGRAADIELVKGGRTLSFTDTDGSKVQDFVTATAARGASGIGAGERYMGPTRLHVGFGLSPTDVSRIVWGAAGAAANAPAWLKAAARRGWESEQPLAPPVVLSGMRSVVTARNGLWLRKGPGLHFDRTRLLDAGTIVTIRGFDGEWARVDLENDGLVDGHMFAAYLAATDAPSPIEGMEEPAVPEETVADAPTPASPRTRSRRR